LYTDYLLQANANKLTTKEERLMFAAYERYVEETYADLQKCLALHGGMASTMILPWKQKGIRPKNSIPKHTFLGRQIDINHQESESYPPMHTDMFQNDPVKGFACAMSMIIHPENLVGHGVWDRARKPGDIIRCPSLPIDTFFRLGPSERDQRILIQKAVNVLEEWTSIAKEKIECWMSWKRPQSSGGRLHFKGVNYELNEQDPDGLLITTCFSLQILFHTSLAHYMRNISIMFAPKTGETDLYDILALYTIVQPFTRVMFPARTGETRSDEQNNQQRTNLQIQQNQQQGAVDDINVLWLIARHLNWAVDDEENRGSILIDRRLLIATQWLSNSIMTFSLLASLLSRKFHLIAPFPVHVRVKRVRPWQDIYTNLVFSSSREKIR
jgi:hypothetical protein